MKRLIDLIIEALENMNKNFCILSNHLGRIKYLERPIAYEFYHQFRKLIEEEKFVIQGEVDKRYQYYFSKGKVPDFIIHIPNTQKNL